MSQASSENLPRRVLLTGATSTIGKEIARQLAESGCEVWAMGRDAETLAQLVSSLPGSGHHSIGADLLNFSSLEKALAKLESEGQEIGGFVHAAAWGTSRPASQVSSQHLENAFRVTAQGFFLISQRLFALRSAGGLSVVAVSSTSAVRGYRASAHYAGAKAALESYARTLAIEWANRGCRVNVVRPGWIESPRLDAFVDRVGTETSPSVGPMGPGKPSDVATAVEFLLSHQARHINAAVLDVDGGTLAT